MNGTSNSKFNKEENGFASNEKQDSDQEKNMASSLNSDEIEKLAQKYQCAYLAAASFSTDGKLTFSDEEENAVWENIARKEQFIAQGRKIGCLAFLYRGVEKEKLLIPDHYLKRLLPVKSEEFFVSCGNSPLHIVCRPEGENGVNVVKPDDREKGEILLGTQLLNDVSNKKKKERIVFDSLRLSVTTKRLDGERVSVTITAMPKKMPEMVAILAIGLMSLLAFIAGLFSQLANGVRWLREKAPQAFQTAAWAASGICIFWLANHLFNQPYYSVPEQQEVTVIRKQETPVVIPASMDSITMAGTKENPKSATGQTTVISTSQSNNGKRKPSSETKPKGASESVPSILRDAVLYFLTDTKTGFTKAYLKLGEKLIGSMHIKSKPETKAEKEKLKREIYHSK